MSYSITKNGKPLNPDLYTIDEKNKTFSSPEDGLVLDFSYKSGWSFKTWDNCIFKTGSHCTFETGSYCTFKTGYYCAFKTGSECTFKTGFECVIVRRDVSEVIQPQSGETIKLRKYGVPGYDIVKPEKLELTLDDIAQKFGVDVKDLKIKK